MAVRSPLRLPAHVAQQLFDDAPALAAALAERVAAALREALAARPAASLVLSGGRSPIPFLRALAERTLDWSRVAVTLADERWVPPEHADSNARLVAEHLLRGPAAAARFVPLYGGEASPEAGLGSCAARLAAMPRPFDAVVLGMGDDGHFASLFPGVPGLVRLLGGVDTEVAPDTAPELAAIVPPRAPHPRITLTLPALLDARALLLPIQGDAKRVVIEAAAERGDAESLPVAALLQQTRTPLQVFFSPAG